MGRGRQPVGGRSWELGTVPALPSRNCLSLQQGTSVICKAVPGTPWRSIMYLAESLLDLCPSLGFLSSLIGVLGSFPSVLQSHLRSPELCSSPWLRFSVLCCFLWVFCTLCWFPHGATRLRLGQA